MHSAAVKDYDNTDLQTKFLEFLFAGYLNIVKGLLSPGDSWIEDRKFRRQGESIWTTSHTQSVSFFIIIFFLTCKCGIWPLLLKKEKILQNVFLSNFFDTSYCEK